MLEQTFKPADRTSFGSDSLTHPHSAFFEDDGQTGYFSAMDLTRFVDMIVDAVHIYNVSNISDGERDSSVSIVWSADGTKCALLINGHAHAAFDFVAKRGYSRTSFPNLPNTPSGCWDSSDHHWSDEMIAWLK
jgi:hypothetical protein